MKMKVVVKLPSSQQKSPVSSESRSSDSNHEDTNAVLTRRKRKIKSIGDGAGIADSRKEEKSFSGANPTRNSQGGQLDSGPSTALPDKKQLLYILDRLQNSAASEINQFQEGYLWRVSEPVDPEELPDYHEVIEHPMDFGTIRKKLASGAYATLEQFESAEKERDEVLNMFFVPIFTVDSHLWMKDVFLICSNAMQYNASDTIYFRQARSIQELAKKNFDNLRQDSDDNEAEPKVIRRGRPPTKNFKKTPGRPSLERAATEFSSDATLATGQENTLCSNHDTGKGSLASDKSNIADSSGKFCGSRNDVYSGSFTENKSDRNDEGYVMKHGEKHFVLDENRRNTYNLFHSSAAREASVLNTFDGERKQLLTVGVYVEHGYTRSLARFAASLGSVAWKIASKKIQECLPAGVNFGPGWVVEKDIPAQRPLQHPSLSLPPGQQTLSLLCSVSQNSCSATESYFPETREVKKSANLKADNFSEKHVQSVSDGHLTAVQPRPPVPIHPGMNGYNNGAYWSNLPAHMEKFIGTASLPGFIFQSSQRLDTVSRTATYFAHPATANSNSNDPKLTENSGTKNLSFPSPNSGHETVATPRSRNHQQPSRDELSMHQKPDSRLSPQQRPDSVLPDLNIGFHLYPNS
ncbi:Ser/Thr-rich protein T10 in DGCR region, putative isoform 1 [Hibiscus syriacus]|uniref:Ser/Thr-rich protein T10 in DGCR region, putative isoform 1 n=1 Tax=Hibiscus syriacus TaxID=106335 RepID=A0A6A3C5E5_HIBSY|nr:Ser/Thr-rich protein T10 in DGCR region, putative isoform 1 [Hibiscus syriacus]